MAVSRFDDSFSKQFAVQSGSCVSAISGIRTLGAVCVLHRNISAMLGAQPENHIQRRFVSIVAKALRRPEQRSPYFLAFPRQLIFGIKVNLFFNGKAALHVCFAFLDLQAESGTRIPVLGSDICQ